MIKLFISTFILSFFLFTAMGDPQQQEPPAGAICSPTTHITPIHACQCTTMGGWMNCKDGKMVNESPGPNEENPTAPPKCDSSCRKNQCTCCDPRYVGGDRSKEKPKDKPKDKPPEKGKKK